MPAGRPLKFKTVEELNEKVKAYFDETPQDEWTITGIAIALDTDRATLINYEKRDEYFNTIKNAKQLVEHAYEKRLIKRGNGGDIFALKNFGWVDKQEIDQKSLNVNLNKSVEDMTEEELIKLANG